MTHGVMASRPHLVPFMVFPIFTARAGSGGAEWFWGILPRARLVKIGEHLIFANIIDNEFVATGGPNATTICQ